jgi:hypothetical protein
MVANDKASGIPEAFIIFPYPDLQRRTRKPQASLSSSFVVWMEEAVTTVVTIPAKTATSAITAKAARAITTPVSILIPPEIQTAQLNAL